MKATEIYHGQWIAENKVIRPLNPYTMTEHTGNKVQGFHIFSKQHTYATDLDGIYQAEELGEVVWQYKFMDLDWKICEGIYHHQSCISDGIPTRQFLTLNPHPMKEETTPTAGLQVDGIKRVTPLIRALYMHQPVMMHPDWESFNDNRPIMVEADHFEYSQKNRWDRGYLLLRPLSSITDDEAVQVAKISYRAEENHTSEVGRSIVSGVFKDDVCFMNPLLWKAVCDMLYQMAFALPWYDLKSLALITVEQQIEYGIIKLKS